MEDVLYEIVSQRQFVGFSLDNAIQDRPTRMNSRRLLEPQQLPRELFYTINQWPSDPDVIKTRDSLVDATIIETPRKLIRWVS